MGKQALWGGALALAGAIAIPAYASNAELSAYANSAMAHKLMMSAKPLDDNNYRLDLEGLLDLEADDGANIPASVRVYTAGFEDGALIERGMKLAQDYYMNEMGVDLNILTT